MNRFANIASKIVAASLTGSESIKKLYSVSSDSFTLKLELGLSAPFFHSNDFEKAIETFEKTYGASSSKLKTVGLKLPLFDKNTILISVFSGGMFFELREDVEVKVNGKQLEFLKKNFEEM